MRLYRVWAALRWHTEVAGYGSIVVRILASTDDVMQMLALQRLHHCELAPDVASHMAFKPMKQ